MVLDAISSIYYALIIQRAILLGRIVIDIFCFSVRQVAFAATGHFLCQQRSCCVFLGVFRDRRSLRLIFFFWYFDYWLISFTLSFTRVWFLFIFFDNILIIVFMSTAIPHRQHWPPWTEGRWFCVCVKTDTILSISNQFQQNSLSTDIDWFRLQSFAHGTVAYSRSIIDDHENTDRINLAPQLSKR